MHLTEEDFPRGGTIKRSDKQIKRKREPNLFSFEKKAKAKKPRKDKVKKTSETNEESWHSSIKLQGTLTYNKLKDGMIVLSCVRHISHLAIHLEFPGLTFGLVTINQISDAFSEYLSVQLKGDSEVSQNALTKILKVGELIPAKISSITKTEKGHEVKATINPRLINGDKKHNSFKRGETIWANVVSKLDHGYELTVGVNNCRVFLPFKNVNSEEDLEVGKPLYCKIHKVENSNFATTLTVGAKRDHLEKVQSEDLILDDVIPGTKVDFFIEEILPNGIKGHFFENCFGYIDESQMFKHIKKVHLKEGGKISAYVLYVEPITRITYLTLRGLEDLPEPDIQIGKVVSAKVSSIVPNGLYLQFKDSNLGFVTNKRLLKTLSKEAQMDITESVRKKYPISSIQNCRILDYNYMQQLYICTLEKHLIKEKIFKVSDLTVGQNCIVKVEKIVNNGLIVKCGLVQGFVPNLHISSVKFSENIKTKFEEGMNISAKVLLINAEGNVIFTLKQGLVNSDKCLAKIEDAVPGNPFVGFVVQTKISGALIAFYGDVRGWISNKVLNTGNSGKYLDPRNYFYIGQVVNVWVLGFKEDKLQLSLNKPDLANMKKVKIGQKVDVTIKRLCPTKLEVEITKNKIGAHIPATHLSNDSVICAILQKLYEPGDKITDLMCVNNSGLSPILSRREFQAFKNHSFKIHKFKDLKTDTLLRCSFEESSDSGIFVTAPIVDFYEKIFIPFKDDFCKEKCPNFGKYQCVMTKVSNVEVNNNKLEVVVCEEYLEGTNINIAVNSLIDTVEDIRYITRLCREKTKPLTAYKIGTQIKCKIERIDTNGECYVLLPNGNEGILPLHLRPPNCKIGSETQGVVLDYDFINNHPIICCKNSVLEKINKKQDGLILNAMYTSCFARILLESRFYILGILNGEKCNGQLIYLPLCFKDYIDSANKMKLKVIPYKKTGNRIVGFPKKFANHFKFMLDKLQAKRKMKNENKIKNEELKVDEIKDEDEESEEENSIKLEDGESEFVGEDEDNVDSDSESDNDVEEKKEFTSSPKSRKRKNSEELITCESVLSGTHSFYSSNDEKFNVTSSEDEEEEVEQLKKRKKLSAAEKIEAAKKEEERIEKIEKELADTTLIPQTAEQFDRQLLANPNSSELWMRYIAMHIAATELEKARTVGKRAIETINPTLVKEKFNVWIALLNLENMYGTKESFEKVFEEAVRYNDSLDIYLNVIKMLATSGKLTEMEDKIKKIRSKEKQSSKMWLEIGRVYYSLNQYREARNIKEAAVKSILDKKRQFDIIVRFGIMEFQMGELEQAIANFETILETYPSKVNIWTIYVDQLVKQKKIDLARKVLERAVSQAFGVKTMKILFQKFINFEEQHGNSEDVEKVKIRAKEFVSRLSGK